MVVTNIDSASGQPFLFQVIGRTLRAETHISKGEIVRNNCPPTVRAEFNGVIHCSTSMRKIQIPTSKSQTN